MTCERGTRRGEVGTGCGAALNTGAAGGNAEGGGAGGAVARAILTSGVFGRDAKATFGAAFGIALALGLTAEVADLAARRGAFSVFSATASALITGGGGSGWPPRSFSLV